MGWFGNRNTNGNNERLASESTGYESAVRRARGAVRRDDSADNRRRLARTESERADWRRKHPGWL
jgi:hypothetical protein